MITLAKPAKRLLFGCVALLLVALLAFAFLRPPERDATAASHPAGPSSDEWTCQWLDEPTIIHGAEHDLCRGVVQCRHRTIKTLTPQIRKVTCRAHNNACDPADCFTRSIRSP